MDQSQTTAKATNTRSQLRFRSLMVLIFMEKCNIVIATQNECNGSIRTENLAEQMPCYNHKYYQSAYYNIL